MRPCYDRHHDSVARPIRQRYAFAILALIKFDHIAGQIEFDIGLVEKIVAEDEEDIVAEIVLSGDRDPPILAHRATDSELIEMNVLGAGLYAETRDQSAFHPESSQA